MSSPMDNGVIPVARDSVRRRALQLYRTTNLGVGAIAKEVGVSREGGSLGGRPRKPVEEFFRQIARFDCLSEFLGDIRFRKNYFHSHRGVETLLWQHWNRLLPFRG